MHTMVTTSARQATHLVEDRICVDDRRVSVLWSPSGVTREVDRGGGEEGVCQPLDRKKGSASPSISTCVPSANESQTLSHTQGKRGSRNGRDQTYRSRLMVYSLHGSRAWHPTATSTSTTSVLVVIFAMQRACASAQLP